MLRISVVLTSLLILGFWTQIFVMDTEENYVHSTSVSLERSCTDNTTRKFSHTVIVQMKNAHAKWIEDPKGSDGSRANFCEADLSNADFVMSMLAGANFKKAKLQRAKLTRANLTRSDFTEARLDGARMDHAMLHRRYSKMLNLKQPL